MSTLSMSKGRLANTRRPASRNIISIDLKMYLLIRFLGFLFHVACHDRQIPCVDTDSNTAYKYVSSVDSDTAWKTCKEHSAILPVIPNEEGHNALRDYLVKHLVGQPIWTAGRYVGSSEWRWLNKRVIITT